MLDAVAVDCFYLCLPPFAHGDLDHQLIELNKPILFEKPVAVDLGVANEIAAHIKEQAIVNAAGYQKRYSSAVQDAKALLKGATIGMAISIRLSGLPGQPWWRVQAQSGGMLVEQHTHAVDLMRLLCGEVESAYAVGNTLFLQETPDLDIFDMNSCTLRFANGAPGIIGNSCASSEGAALFPPHLVHIVAKGMVLSVNDKKSMVRHADGCVQEFTRQEDDDYLMNKAFIDAVRSGHQSGILSDYADATCTLAVTLACQLSAERGLPINLTEFIKDPRVFPASQTCFFQTWPMVKSLTNFGINLMVWSGQLGAAEMALLPHIRGMGYHSVELPIFAAESVDCAAFRTVLESSGLTCTVSTAMPAQTNLIDARSTPAALEFLESVIRQAAALNAPIVCGPVAMPVGELRGRGYLPTEWQQCVLSLRQVGEIAARHGVVLALEPLNRFETFFLNTTEDALRLMDEVNHPAVGLLLDTFHMHIEEKSTPAAIRGAGRHLRHFHASENDRGIVGSGQVPWKEIVQALQAANYTGPITVESFNAIIPELAGATCIWRPLASSADELARESLLFLQGLVDSTFAP